MDKDMEADAFCQWMNEKMKGHWVKMWSELWFLLNRMEYNVRLSEK